MRVGARWVSLWTESLRGWLDVRLGGRLGGLVGHGVGYGQLASLLLRSRVCFVCLCVLVMLFATWFEAACNTLLVG